jgi:uncharacterized protein YqiB (DUF1249 family)
MCGSDNVFLFVSEAVGHHTLFMDFTLLHRPKTSGRFAALMDLYERNYMQMRLLAPRLASMKESVYVSETDDDSLPLEILELTHERYTSTFRLTYRLSERWPQGKEPNLAMRLYHDARTCEVMSGLLPGETTEARRVRDLEHGLQLNSFLNRWLAYCLQQGHGFEGARVQRHAGEAYPDNA